MTKQTKQNVRGKKDEMSGMTAFWFFFLILTLFTQSWINFGVWVVYTYTFLINDHD